jgi:Tfp pilus assembly protein PilF
MNRRWISGLVAAMALAALIGQTVRAADRLRSSQLLKTVEATTPGFARQGAGGRPWLALHLRALSAAQQSEPSNVALVTAAAAQLYLLNRLDEAEAEYRRALAIEPRAEVWLNLGRTLWQKGDSAQAREAFTRALALNPRLADQLPAGAQAQS